MAARWTWWLRAGEGQERAEACRHPHGLASISGTADQYRERIAALTIG